MKITPAKKRDFLNSVNDSGYSGVLLFGVDSGGVSNSAKDIYKRINPNFDDPFSSVEISEETLSDQPSIVADEMLAMSFGGGKRIVKINNITSREARKNLIDSLPDLPQDIHKDSFLVVTAGDLPATSALRKFFEKSKNFASIAFYVEDARGLNFSIDNIARKLGLNIMADAKKILAEYCQGDSKIIENEIKKLALYKGEDRNITAEDVRVATGNTTEIGLQNICNAVFDAKKDVAQIYLKDALENGVQPIAIIRSQQKYLEKLHLAYKFVKQDNYQIKDAMSKLRPPIFFKQAPIFQSHLVRLLGRDEKAIYRKYSVLFDAESRIKETNSNPDIITSRLLQFMAS